MRARDLLGASTIVSLAWPAALVALSCSSDPAPQIEVRIDSDYAATEIGSIGVDVTWSGTGSAKHLRCGGAHPFSFRIDAVADRLDVPARVVVRAYDPRGAPLVARVGESAFAPGEVRLLRMDLMRACAAVACGDTETCINGACRVAGETPVSTMEPDTPETPTNNCEEGTLDATAGPDARADAEADAGASTLADADAGAGIDADADTGALDAPVDVDGSDHVLGTFTAIWHPATDPEIETFGASYDAFVAKYDQLRPDGWRVFTMQPYVMSRSLFYNALWRKSTADEQTAYGVTRETLEAEDALLGPQGWRLAILEPYVLNDDVRYSAVWRRSAEAQTVFYGLTPDELQTKITALNADGLRVELLKPYVVAGAVRYAVVLRPGSASEQMLLDVSYTDFRAKYDAVWQNGYRVYILENYRLNGKFYYTATWRPGSALEHQAYAYTYKEFRTKHDPLQDSGWRLSILRAF